MRRSLLTRGLTLEQADALLRPILAERDAEFRAAGLGQVFFGGGLLAAGGVAAGVRTWVWYPRPLFLLFAGLALVGLWILAGGIARVVMGGAGE